ncbi:MAG: retropepsin-like domain-containing protein [Parvularculaceae bacterium]|nr:retropepsin-like domain-containing protein [Parvularculaceae bacterium]
MRMIFLAVALASSGAAEAATPACTPMEMRRGRPFVEIVLNGAKLRALVDTGAEMTLIDAAYARAAGLEKGVAATVKGSGGTETAHALPEVRLVVAGRAIPGVTPFAIDLSDVAKRLFKEKVDVVLGREIYDAERVLLDYPGGRLCLVGRDAEPKGKKLALQTAHGLETIPIDIEGKPVRADIDSGNSGALLLGGAFVDGAGFLTDGRKLGENRGGGIGGAIARKRFITKSVTIAGETFKGAPAVIDPQPNAASANVGSGLLKYFRVTLDYRDAAAWFERAE